jgi:hypothetical protein
MSFFALIFKLIPYLVPFLREMILGKKTWRQAFRENRGKTILTLVVVISVIFNVLLMTKAGTLAYHYLELSRANEELKQKMAVVEKNKALPEGSSRHPIVNSTEVVTEVKRENKAHSTSKADTNLAEEVRSDFERIRQREATEH